MALFSRKKSAPVATTDTGSRARVIGPIGQPLSARQAFEIIEPLANRQNTSRRLILVLSGTDLDLDGRAGTWQFLFVYPDEQAEATYTLHVGSHEDHRDEVVVTSEVKPFPEPGSPQEAMLLYQGPTARLIVEQQWADRLERLPGLPERFIDSTMALRDLRNMGASWDPTMLSPVLKGRTLPGGQTMWELTLSSGIFRSRFV
jgi:hypothetical protein